jgi:hypothetical protein
MRASSVRRVCRNSLDHAEPQGIEKAEADEGHEKQVESVRQRISN